MSTGKQSELIELMQILYDRLFPILKIEEFKIENRNSIFIGKITENAVIIEIIYGPPEFHTELFITVISTMIRYDLRMMINIAGVREWMLDNKPKIGGYNLKSEFDWIEKFITKGIRNKKEFINIYRKQKYDSI